MVSTHVDDNVYLQCLNKNQESHIDSWQVDFAYSVDAQLYAQTLSKYYMHMCTQQNSFVMNPLTLCFNHILFGAPRAMQNGFYANVIRTSTPFRNFLKHATLFHTAESKEEIDNQVYKFITRTKSTKDGGTKEDIMKAAAVSRA